MLKVNVVDDDYTFEYITDNAYYSYSWISFDKRFHVIGINESVFNQNHNFVGDFVSDLDHFKMVLEI
ncbi:MAG: hypothetical protein E6R13_06715 [Spirochaetes bacterium]|nr:MAG: hypothetical protein E6R13_06715 [Spirochaetota bacterium]